VFLQSLDMPHPPHVFAKFCSDTFGASSIAYAMITAVIAAALLSAGSYWGQNLNTTFEAAEDGFAVAAASGNGGHGSSSDGSTQPGSTQAGSSPSDGEGSSGTSAAAGTGGAEGPVGSGDQASGDDAGRLILTER